MTHVKMNVNSTDAIQKKNRHGHEPWLKVQDVRSKRRLEG